MQLAQLATKLGTSTAQGAARAEKEIMLREGAPELRPLSPNMRPSELLGQAFSNVVRPLKMQTLESISQPAESLFKPSPEALPPQPPPVQRSAGNIWTEMLRAFGGSALGETKPSNTGAIAAREVELPRQRGDTTFVGSEGGDGSLSVPRPLRAVATPLSPSLPSSAAALRTAESAAPVATNPLMQLASAFFKGGGAPAARPAASGVSTAVSSSSDGIPRSLGSSSQPSPQLPGIRDVVPGATSNFGIPKGKGCLPFLGEFMQIAYGNCVKEADERAYAAWGEELQSAVIGGKMDLLRATRETCKRGAEREQCNQLRRAISDCDIMQSLQIAASLQRELKRCEEISAIVDQNPVNLLGQVNNLINGEFASGLLNNFLG